MQLHLSQHVLECEVEGTTTKLSIQFKVLMPWYADLPSTRNEWQTVCADIKQHRFPKLNLNTSIT